MEWISVKKDLPDAYQYVLVCEFLPPVYCEPCPLSIARHDGSQWELLWEGENNAWACGDLTWGIESKDISHWMSLPLAPKD
jgi:hypothetical protein